MAGQSDFPSGEDDGEAWEVQERAARTRAIPLRSIVEIVGIVEMVGDGKTVRLACGHVKKVRTQLEVGNVVRCLPCYVDGMRRAKKMMERDYG